MDERPVGIFDSGLGGLTVVKEIKKVLPDESLVYLGDTARVPYGPRSKETVTEFSLQDVEFLLKHKVKCIVIACNTASAFSFQEIRKKVNLPIFDVITPASKRAALVTKAKKIGVIGTRGTIRSRAYQKLIRSFNSRIEVFAEASPLLVPAIEEGEIEGELITMLAKKYLLPLKAEKIDVLILGCTHYPIIEDVIRREMGKGVLLVNSGEEVTQVLSNFLKKRGLKAPKNLKPMRKYYVTDLTERFVKIAEMFLVRKLDGKIERVTLE